MKIIGHRGASGLALENTLAGLELARLLGVDAIELDVRLTGDGTLVVCHDTTLTRVSGHGVRVGTSTLKQVQAVILNDGQSTVPTLAEALEITGDVPLIVELKGTGCVPEIIKLLKKHERRDISIASFRHGELSKLREAGVSVPLLALEQTKPFEIIDAAKQKKFDGIGLNFWLLNPLTYWLTRRAGLSIYVYTINSHILGKLISWLYPHAGICTDHPEWFIKHPWLKVRSSFFDKQHEE